MSIYLDLKNSCDFSKLKDVANAIKLGGIVLFPTETVYGLGTNGLDENAVKKIFLAKGRDFKNPINLLISNMDMVNLVAKDISELEYKLMEAFFPGPFTIILNKKDIVPDIVTAGQKNVGLRMPSGEIAKKLVEYSGVPIAAPSANISGKPSGTSFTDIFQDFNGKVDYMIDGGNSSIGIESTIVKVINNTPHILRPGSITAEQIKNIAGNVVYDYSDIPSNKLKHYTLNSKSVLVYSNDNNKLVNKILEIANSYTNPIIIAKSENIVKYSNFQVIDMGSGLEEIAKHIFTILKNTDKTNSDIIIIEGIEQTGIGIAIMNRLIKACEGNFIEI